MMTTRHVMAIGLMLLTTSCAIEREQSGALLGGAVGAAAGSTVGGGSGRAVAIILGALVGSSVGAEIGHRMDEQDRVRTAEAMEYARTDHETSWRNPDTGAEYTVTPRRTFDGSDGPCREFTMNAAIGGKPRDVYGTACRRADGSWEIVR